MTNEVREKINNIIAMLSFEREEIKPEILNWLELRFKEILKLKPRFIDVHTVEECKLVRDEICSEHESCGDGCPLFDKNNHRDYCIVRFMIEPYNSKYEKYFLKAKEIIKRKEKEKWN